MARHTQEHLTDAFNAVKEMWDDAPADLRDDMRSKLQVLMNELK